MMDIIAIFVIGLFILTAVAGPMLWLVLVLLNWKMDRDHDRMCRKTYDPIKMKNGKDGMMWGGNNYTIKTNQDNPFATGVSINQDMVMEETIPILDLKKTRQLRRMAKPIAEWKEQIERAYYMSVSARTAKGERQLLALGREEE